MESVRQIRELLEHLAKFEEIHRKDDSAVIEISIASIKEHLAFLSRCFSTRGCFSG